MEGCDCIEPLWPADELLVKYQYISDFFIALAYFSIPLELIYFVKKSSFFPYRWVLIQFGAFIVLCGATHLINLWTFTMHSKTLAIVMTIAKNSTAVVSCATTLMLVHIIPDLLSVKTRESFLKNKAEELDREMGLIRTQEETGRHVRMLTHEIRSTLDRDTILKTTLVELGRTLGLEECALWMPSSSGHILDLSKLEDRSLELELGAFNLHSVFREVVNFVKPVAAVKKLPVSLILSSDLPLCAIGDEKRLMEIILNVAGIAIKFTKEGHISIIASIARTDYLRDFRTADFYPVACDGHFYLRVQV